MRIIFTTQFSPWSAYHGGGQLSTHNLATAMAEKGHDVRVVYTKPPWEDVAVPSDLPYQVCWSAMPSLQSRRRAVLRPLSAVFVMRTVRKMLTTAAVVHSSGEEAALLPRLRGRQPFRFIITPRYPSYPRELLQPTRRIAAIIRTWLVHGKFVQLGAAIRGAQMICPTSRSAADQIMRAYNVEPERVRVVPNGVSDVYRGVNREGHASSGPIVFFGRLAYSKGADLLLQAISRLGDPDVSCVIIGRGEEHRALRETATLLGIRSRIRFEDWMPPPELAHALTSASMAVLPSREESFGNAIAEAMATGVPVVSTGVGSVPELITHGKTGMIVPPDDPDALAEAIRRLRADPEHAAAIGQAARREIVNRFTWDRVAERFESLYEELPRS